MSRSGEFIVPASGAMNNIQEMHQPCGSASSDSRFCLGSRRRKLSPFWRDAVDWPVCSSDQGRQRISVGFGEFLAGECPHIDHCFMESGPAVCQPVESHIRREDAAERLEATTVAPLVDQRPERCKEVRACGYLDHRENIPREPV